jgi:D-alanine-D-alanine ligase
LVKPVLLTVGKRLDSSEAEEGVMNKARVGVIMGGASGERDVSLQSGAAVAKALLLRGHDVVRIVLSAGGDPGLAIRRSGIDVAFLALHGRLGEDGCVQGLCELYGIPYTGSSVLASALAMDKVKSKELFRLHNLPTPPYYTASAVELENLEAIHGSFGFPVVVKPRSQGSSLGVGKASSLGELRAALDEAFRFDETALIERFVAGKEVHVGILNGRVLGAIEVVPKKGLYDYEAKYTPGMTDYFMPARLPTTRYGGVLRLAERAAQALGCSSAVRIDLLVTEGENEYVLEVNTLPGMTETSLLPKIAESAGYDFGQLCEVILETARLHSAPVPRHVQESRSEFQLDELEPRRATG